jgi:hypothetical protein
MHPSRIVPVLLGTALICSTTSNLPAEAFMISGSINYTFTNLSVGTPPGTPVTPLPSGIATFEFDTITQAGTVLLPLTVASIPITVTANINAVNSTIDQQSGLFSALSATSTENGSNLGFKANFAGTSFSSCGPSECGTFKLSGTYALSQFIKPQLVGAGGVNSYSQAPEPPVTPGLLTLMVLAMKSKRTSKGTSIKATE